MRRALVLLLTLAAFLGATGTALAHPQLLSTDPQEGARLATSPSAVTMTFGEAVEVPRTDAIDVVGPKGVPASSGPAHTETDARIVTVPLRPGLPEGTYTVRWSVVGSDSHVVTGVFVFGIGGGALAPPDLSGNGTGPSETGVWGTSSRFLELLGLGGLIGLIAFRWLIWAPAFRARAAALPEGEREAALSWGRDTFWVGFGILAVGAMVAEGYLLVVQSAGVLGTGVLSALRDANGVSEVLGNTRFGSLIQLRGALLFGLFALGAVMFLREYGSSATPQPAAPSGPRWAALVMTGLLGAVIWAVADQGHASVADLPGVQVAAQLAHIVSVSVWIAGLALVGLVHLRLPRIAPAGGGAVASAVLARFSRIALVAVTVAVLTGVVRSYTELNDPAELWTTAYGRSILIKIGLLLVVAPIALYSRRIVVALRRVRRPNAPTTRLVSRLAGLELVLSLAILVVAALLAAQVPAGTG